MGRGGHRLPQSTLRGGQSPPQPGDPETLCNPSLSSMEQLCDCRVFSCLSKQGNCQRQGKGRFQPGNHNGLLHPPSAEGGSQGSPLPTCARRPHRSPDWVMSRRQVSICTSRPRFMLHISMYSCRWRFMSFLAVASSSCRGRASGQQPPLPALPGG